MDLVFNSPWPMFTLVAAAVASALWAFRRYPSRARLAAVIVAALLLPLPWILDALVETPTERVDGILDALVAAGLERRVDDVLVHVSTRFEHPEVKTRQQLGELLRRELDQFRPQTLRFNGRLLSRNGPTIVARFVAVTSGEFRGQRLEHFALRLALAFEQEEGHWRITRIQRFETVGNTNEEISLLRR